MKKRITKKQIKDYLLEVANINNWEHSPGEFSKVYESKFDGSYLNHVGNENQLKFLLIHGITEQLQTINRGSSCIGRTTCLGFNPKEQKWYGWSHRALYGFGIGNTCKSGDCAYRPSNKEEFLENMVQFWNDPDFIQTINGEEWFEPSIKQLGVKVIKRYNNKVPNESLRGTINEHFEPYPDQWGRGEWVATTLEEAKQMAIDFAEGVS